MAQTRETPLHHAGTQSQEVAIKSLEEDKAEVHAETKVRVKEGLRVLGGGGGVAACGLFTFLCSLYVWS